MKYFRIFLVNTIIFLTILSILFFSEKQSHRLDVSEFHIKIHKDKITLYNDIDEIIDKVLIKDKIKEYSIGDVNGDGENELIILSGDKKGEYGKNLIIFDLGDNIKEIGRKDFTELNPWKIVIGDIDGDGIDEISVGVYKESPLHQVMAKRPFIYSFNNGDIQPKWRGSRLSRPFTDYCFYDIDEDGVDEIISIEILQDEKRIINTYKWKGFGFEGYLESKVYDDITDLILKERKIYINIREGKSIYKGLIKLVDDNLIIERVN